MKPEAYIEDMYEPKRTASPSCLCPARQARKRSSESGRPRRPHPSRYSAGCDTTTPRATISTSR